MSGESTSLCGQSGEEVEFWEGFSLMDVLNITHYGSDEVEPKKQRGEIHLNNYGGCWEVEVDMNNKIPIKSGDAITVTDTEPFCYGDTSFIDEVSFMTFDLFCGAYEGIKEIEWEPRMDEVSVERVCLFSTDGTEHILVVIGKFGNASLAKLKVKLLDNSDKNVYGAVFASNSELELPDCASVLFLKKRANAIKLGHDGVIPLSKSHIGVPLHSALYVEIFLNIDGDNHTAIASFFPKQGRRQVEQKTVSTNKNAMISVHVTWNPDENSDKNSYSDVNPDKNSDSDVNSGSHAKRCSSSERLICLCAGCPCRFEVKESVALKFHLLKDWIEESNAEKHHYQLSGITCKTLKLVIRYCTLLITSTSKADNFIKKLRLGTLFNLIQAAYNFKIENLMELTCQTLANMVKKEREIDEPYIRSTKRFKRDLQASNIYSECPDVDSKLRQRGKETFINKGNMLFLPIPSFATKWLSLVKDWNKIFDMNVENFERVVNSHPEDIEKLVEATKCLHELICGDIGLADRLSDAVVMRLLQIVNKIDKMKRINIAFEGRAVYILAFAISRKKFNTYLQEAVAAIVKLMSDPLTPLGPMNFEVWGDDSKLMDDPLSYSEFEVVGVVALTYLAFTSPSCIKVILASDALEKVREILKSQKFYDVRWPIRIHSIAEFLAAVCSGHLPENKVNVALTISKDLLQKGMKFFGETHIVYACYALQYLTYERNVEIEEELLNELIKLINSFNTEVKENYSGCLNIVEDLTYVFGSALGVLGNVARWGQLQHIQTLTEKPLLLQWLGMLTSSKFKKFCKEACQIISNIAARSKTWKQDIMHKANLIEPLCKVLENGMYEHDVKMEAAWAIYNGMYVDKYQQQILIDKYPRDNNSNLIESWN